jgi:hypothetical protein
MTKSGVSFSKHSTNGIKTYFLRDCTFGLSSQIPELWYIFEGVSSLFYLSGVSLRANYTGRSTAACRPS